MGCASVLSVASSHRYVDHDAMIYGVAGICVGLPLGIVIGVNLAFWMVEGIK
jgi:hypothetical protein